MVERGIRDLLLTASSQQGIVANAVSPVSSRGSAQYCALGTAHMGSSYRTENSAKKQNKAKG